MSAPRRPRPSRRAEPADQLVGAIHDAALDPQLWPAVLLQLKQCFRSEAETFYVLDFTTRRVREAHLSGIEPVWLARFDEHYFSADNPWLQHSLSLHRPGVVRTNERLDGHARAHGVLYRSRYYNEWMRPQGLKHSLGNTLTTDRSGIANVTLLRAPDLPTFDAQDIRLFERLNGHFMRALRIRALLGEARLQRNLLAGALDSLHDGMLLLSSDARLLHGNRAGLELLAQGRGLTFRRGCVTAADDADRDAFCALLREHGAPLSGGVDAEALVLRGGSLRVQASVLELPIASPQAPQRCVLLSLSCASPDPLPPALLLCRVYGLTPAEARLAAALLDGRSLREVAQQLHLSYETVRTRLKVVFGKTGTRRQAELVAQLQRRVAMPVEGASGRA